ncbi:MAG TPA: methylmalonyl-CoA mutase family protein, partial [Candidatus Limnocylindrales bacterium]
MTWQARKRAWERERLDPVRARSPERSPRFTTISDVEVARLYGPWDWVPSNGEPGAGGATGADGDDTTGRDPAGAGGPTAVDHRGDRLRAGRWDAFDPLRDIGFPGEPPFTRGVHPTGYRGRAWTMRMFAGFGAAEDT